MDSRLLSAGLGDLDEGALVRLARAADRVLAGGEASLTGPRLRDRPTGAGLEFLDFQPHAPGGDARRVDWRASARGRDLVERRYRDATSGTWWVCLDRSASMGRPGSARRRLSLQLAAAMSFLLLHREHRVALMTFADGVDGGCPPGRGRAQFARVLRVLAADRPGGTRSRLEACAGRVARRQSVAVISDFLAEDAMLAGLGRLLRRGARVHALQLWDDVGSPPAAGPVNLRDAETGATVRIPEPDAAAVAAATLLDRQRAELEAFCRRHRVAHSVCRSHQRWSDGLLGHLARARRLDA